MKISDITKRIKIINPQHCPNCEIRTAIYLDNIYSYKCLYDGDYI